MIFSDKQNVFMEMISLENLMVLYTFRKVGSDL